MGFNWGAFAGAAAKSGVDTYLTMTDVQRKEREMALREEEAARQKEQFGWARSEQEGKTALREAIASQGDLTTTSPSQMMAGPAPQGVPTGTYEGQPAGGYTIPGATPEQKLSNIQQRALTGGANPADVGAFVTGHLALKTAQRQAKLDDQFDSTMNTMQKESTDRLNTIRTTAESGGLKGLTETFGPELKKAFGHDVKYSPVPGGNGEITVMDGKKVVTRISNLGDATAALEKLAEQEFSSKFEKAMLKPGMFKSSAELGTFLNKREELKNQGKSADAAVKSAEAAMMNAKTNQQAEGAKSEYYKALAKKAGMTLTDQKLEEIAAQSTIMMRADPKLTKEQADLKSAQIIFKSPELRADVVTPDQINTFIQNNPDLMQKKGKSGKMEPLSGEERADVARKALSRGMGGGAPTNATDAALKALSNTAPGADPFATPSKTPPGTVDTDKVPAPQSAIPTAGPVRHGNIDPALQDKMYANITALDQQIKQVEDTLRTNPNLANAQNLQQLRAERAKLAANPLLR